MLAAIFRATMPNRMSMMNAKRPIDHVEAVFESTMEMKAGTVYEHDEYDQVVVLGVHRVYQTYETDTDEGTLDSVVIRWADE